MYPSEALIKEVRIGFIRQGTTLKAFCRAHQKDASNARKALLGTWNGEKAQVLREFIVVNALGSHDESMD